MQNKKKFSIPLFLPPSNRTGFCFALQSSLKFCWLVSDICCYLKLFFFGNSETIGSFYTLKVTFRRRSSFTARSKGMTNTILSSTFFFWVDWGVIYIRYIFRCTFLWILANLYSHKITTTTVKIQNIVIIPQILLRPSSTPSSW